MLKTGNFQKQHKPTEIDNNAHVPAWAYSIWLMGIPVPQHQ